MMAASDLKNFGTFYASRDATLNILVSILKSVNPLIPNHGFSWQLWENINYFSLNRAGIGSVISNGIAVSACNLEFKEQGNGKFKSILICNVWSYYRAWRSGSAKRYFASNQTTSNISIHESCI